jgi:orotate phosphoribosyltransferase-like protein
VADETCGVSEDHRWIISQNLAPYTGKWIAVAHRSIIACGVSLKEVISQARKQEPDPLFLRVPEGYITV